MLSSYLVQPLAIQDVFDSPGYLLIAVIFIGVLISDLIGNHIAFGQRFLNALVTGSVAALLAFVASRLLPSLSGEVIENPGVFIVVFGGVFVSDLIGNFISFKSRLGNALITAAVAALLVFVVLYSLQPELFTG